MTSHVLWTEDTLQRQDVSGANFCAVVSIFAVVFIGCRSPNLPALHLVFIPDLSKSIEASARQACAEAIMNASTKLVRGDAIVVIPITDNVAEQAPARVARSRLGMQRSAFDDDLMQVLASERVQLERMCGGVPSSRSDIFTSLLIAGEDLAQTPGSLRAIAILSDFIEDDPEHCFTREKELGSPAAAIKFAAQLASQGVQLNGIQIYLGRVPSVTFPKLPDARREAIKAFWIEYLRRKGAQVEWATDGLGGLAPFVARLTSGRGQQETAAVVLGLDQ